MGRRERDAIDALRAQVDALNAQVAGLTAEVGRLRGDVGAVRDAGVPVGELARRRAALDELAAESYRLGLKYI